MVSSMPRCTEAGIQAKGPQTRTKNRTWRNRSVRKHNWLQCFNCCNVFIFTCWKAKKVRNNISLLFDNIGSADYCMMTMKKKKVEESFCCNTRSIRPWWEVERQVFIKNELHAWVEDESDDPKSLSENMEPHGSGSIPAAALCHHSALC